jgi:hypothetical protein
MPLQYAEKIDATRSGVAKAAPPWLAPRLRPDAMLEAIKRSSETEGRGGTASGSNIQTTGLRSESCEIDTSAKQVAQVGGDYIRIGG